LSIDEEGYKAALQAQKERSRKDASTSAEDWVILQEVDKIEFVGYDEFETVSSVVKYQKVQKNKVRNIKWFWTKRLSMPNQVVRLEIKVRLVLVELQLKL
jgi:alanyl-tRNA synthetase